MYSGRGIGFDAAEILADPEIVKEISIDDFKDKERMYRLELIQKSDQSPKWAISHKSWHQDYVERISEIEDFVFLMSYRENTKVSIEEKDFFEDGSTYCLNCSPGTGIPWFFRSY